MSDEEMIEGLKLIHLTGVTSQADDPSYPYKLCVNFSPPELMQVAFIMMHGGSEELIVRGMTREAIDEFMRRNELRNHPRLRHGEIMGPDGQIEKFAR